MKLDLISWLVGAMLSGLVGFVISRHFSARRRLFWFSRSRRILDPVGGSYPDELELRYKGQEIGNLREWRFGIWNGGNQAIQHKDFLDDGKLTIEFDGNFLKGASDIVQSRNGIVNSIDIIEDRLLEIECGTFNIGDAVAFSVYTSFEGSNVKIIQPKILGNLLNVEGGLSRAKILRSDILKNRSRLIFATLFYATLSIALSYLSWLNSGVSVEKTGLYVDSLRMFGEENAAYGFYFTLALSYMFAIISIFGTFTMLFALYKSLNIGLPKLIVEHFQAERVSFGPAASLIKED